MDAQITDLIRPHTGRVKEVRTITNGFGVSTTFVASCETGEWFVKATPNKPGGNLDAAKREAAVNPFVRALSPAIRWRAEDEDWFVLGFEVVDGRTANIEPGSVDLPNIIEAVDVLSDIPLPEVAHGWEDTRWDRFATEDEQKLLRGDTLTHTDIHHHNVLISPDRNRTWVVDWEWPTRGSEVITPSALVVQLVAAGHSPADAEAWMARGKVWQRAAREAIDAFARANARMHQWFVEIRPDEDWLKAMLGAAEAWANHCDAW
jgi:hypothetical protein